MIEGVEELYLIIDEEFADGFGIELLIDNFETDLTKLFVRAFVDSGGEAGANFLEYGELIIDSFVRLGHTVFFDIIKWNRKQIILLYLKIRNYILKCILFN